MILGFPVGHCLDVNKLYCRYGKWFTNFVHKSGLLFRFKLTYLSYHGYILGV